MFLFNIDLLSIWVSYLPNINTFTILLLNLCAINQEQYDLKMLEQSCKIEKFHNSILLSVYCEKCFFLSDDTCMFFKKEKKRNHLIRSICKSLHKFELFIFGLKDTPL